MSSHRLEPNEGATILIVEDDPGVARLEQRQLQRSGHTVLTAATPEEALRHLEQQAVDMLLLDYRLPGDLDGLDFYDKLRASGYTLPVILVTGFSDEGTVIRALRAGVLDVVPKSVEYLEYLPAAVKRALRLARTEQQLAESEARLAAVIESAKDAIIIVGSDKRIALFNRAAEQMFRCPAQEAVGQRLIRFIRPAFGPQPAEAGREGTAEDTLTHFVRGGTVGVRADGEEFPLEANAARAEADGRRYHTVVVRDITERRRAEEALRQSEARFRSFVESTRDWVWAIDQERHLTYSNPAVEAILGYRPEELLGKDLLNYLDERDRPRVEGLWPKWLGGESGWTGQILRWRHKAGGCRFLESSTVPIRCAGGEVVGFRGVDRDITDRVRADEQIRAQAALLDQANDAILVLDLAGRITFWNRGAERLYGRVRGECLGASVATLLFRSSLPPDLGRTLRTVLEEGEWRGELAQATKDDKEIVVNSHWTLVYDTQGQPASVLVINTDITEQKALENQFRHSQRMEGIGRLAGGIAHDFNNLLTVILGYSEMVIETLSPQDPSRDLVTTIRQAGYQAVALTRQLLAFSRKQIRTLQILDLNEIIHELEKMLRRLLGEDITLDTALDPVLGCVQADPGQVEQVLLNLAINARDAMQQGGRLTIATRNVGPNVPGAVTPAEVARGPCVLLTVSDTGCGMDPAIASQVFEPFFTTKGPEAGTGLGLSTVYGIIKQSDGHIEVASEVGRGTTFSIYLPRVKEEAARPRRPDSLFKAPPGSETILLAEDEDDVRLLASLALQSFGYTLLEAPNGEAALDLGRRHEGPIHLLVTDVVMPRMSGRELAEGLQATHPGLRVLYLSGYTDDAVVRHGIEQPAVAFLQKPFTPTTLALKVREVLDRSG